MTRRDLLADAILSCKTLTARYLVGFDDTNHTRQAPSLPNHVAWSLGHCALTMHRAAEKLDGKGLPRTEFVSGPVGVETVSTHSVVPPGAFNTEAVSFGSKPVDDPRLYPPFLRCGEIYNAACDRLAAAIRAADEAKLDVPAKWGQGEIPLHALMTRMIFHNGAHVGQIADLRRALNFRSIFA
jgi:hypothetical protein